MSSSIFGNQQPQEQFQIKVDTHSKALVSVVERQKDLESSIYYLQEKLELMDKNNIETFRKIFKEIKEIKSESTNINQEIITIKEFNKKIKNQMKLFASRDEVLKVEKYVDLWNPMEFATKKDVENISNEIKEKIIEKIESYLGEKKNI